jgi:hypothetical protein
VGKISELDARSLGVVLAIDATTQVSLFSSFSRKSPMSEAFQLCLTQFAKKKLTFICIGGNLFYFNSDLFIQILTPISDLLPIGGQSY